MVLDVRVVKGCIYKKKIEQEKFAVLKSGEFSEKFGIFVPEYVETLQSHFLQEN